MIISIHQPEFLPWIPFFHKMKMADVFVLLDNVQFEKNYFQNRAKVLQPNGNLQLVAIPVKKTPLDTKINEIEIDTNNVLIKKSLKSIQQYYQKKPYFEVYYSSIEQLILKNQFLGKLNSELIQFIQSILAINTKVYIASELDIDHQESGSRLLANICKHFDATHYISGRFGIDYLNEEDFSHHHIELIYQELDIKTYNQHTRHDFVPYTSIIDLIFNEGENSNLYI